MEFFFLEVFLAKLLSNKTYWEFWEKKLIKTNTEIKDLENRCTFFSPYSPLLSTFPLHWTNSRLPPKDNLPNELIKGQEEESSSAIVNHENYVGKSVHVTIYIFM